MIKNRYLYDKNDFNNYFSTDVCSYKEDVLNGLKNGKCCSTRNVAALSNLLQCLLQSIHQKISNLCGNRDFFKKISTHNMNLFYLTKPWNWESYGVILQMQAYFDRHRIPVIVVSPNSNQRRIETNNTLMMKNDHFREKIFFHYNSKKQYKKENNKHDRLKTVPTKHQR